MKLRGIVNYLFTTAAMWATIVTVGVLFTCPRPAGCFEGTH